MKALPPVFEAGYPVGLVADQSGGDRGVFVPFFGRLTSTYKSIGMLAMQYNAVIICGTARRLRHGETPFSEPRVPFANSYGPSSMRYSVELIDVFRSEDWNTNPDPLYYISARYRRAMETMIRRAPEQYLWMHRMWRSRAGHERHGKPFPPQLLERLKSLPWMTDDDLARIVDRSARDAKAVAEGDML
jgi:KDO2-lipid IV(A) lauroyltransferase